MQRLQLAGDLRAGIDGFDRVERADGGDAVFDVAARHHIGHHGSRCRFLAVAHPAVIAGTGNGENDRQPKPGPAATLALQLLHRTGNEGDVGSRVVAGGGVGSRRLCCLVHRLRLTGIVDAKMDRSKIEANGRGEKH
ncbi:hypothetical protein D9M72_386400 [compost metagenome]